MNSKGRVPIRVVPKPPKCRKQPNNAFIDDNTCIIVDDVLSFTVLFRHAMTMLESQLRVARSQRLSLSLRKCHFFPTCLEFVGTDVTPEGNRPAQSKHELLKTWPTPTIVKDVSSSFIGFAVFYSRFIPMFEVCFRHLSEICKNESTLKLGELWHTEAQAEFNDIRDSILSDPVLKRYDYRH